MEYRELGGTGLRASVVGFGAEWIGEMSDVLLADVVACLGEAGVNIVDCWMADPEIRRRLGQALAPHRDSWIIQGHIGSTWQNGQYVRTRDMRQVIPAFEDELRLLQTDHFELGMIHYVDAVDEFQQIMDGPFYEYVRTLKQAGTIRHVGLSTHNPHVALVAAETGVVEMMMLSINPAFDTMPASDDINALFGDLHEGGEGIDPVRERLYATCEERGIGITVMKPYAGGRLLDAGKSPFGKALTPVQCIHYCLTRPAVTSVLVGVKDVAQAQAALAYADATDDQKNYGPVLAQAPVHSYYGQCIYCGHCQPCTEGIEIATVNKFADLAKMQETVPESVRQHYLALEANASDCIACGTCEPNCPFGVPIVQRMQETAELFA